MYTPAQCPPPPALSPAPISVLHSATRQILAAKEASARENAQAGGGASGGGSGGGGDDGCMEVDGDDGDGAEDGGEPSEAPGDDEAAVRELALVPAGEGEINSTRKKKQSNLLLLLYGIVSPLPQLWCLVACA